MKQTAFYEAPSIDVVVLSTESAFLTSSGQENLGMQDLIYDDIFWN